MIRNYKSLLLLSALFYTSFAHAQKPPDRLPFYPGNEDALSEYIESNLKMNQEKKITEGSIQLSFDVKPDSSVASVVIIEGLHPMVDEQVIKLLERARFAPAIKEGKAVKMNMMTEIPVHLKQ